MESFESIRRAIEAGTEVYWKNESYPVVKDSLGQFLINHKHSCVGLVESVYDARDFFAKAKGERLTIDCSALNSGGDE